MLGRYEQATIRRALDAPAEEREEDDPGGPGNEDDEPSLCGVSVEPLTDDEDLEDEFDGREDDADREPDVDDELTGDNEPSLGAAEPLEPEAGVGSVWCGEWSKFTKAERAAVYDQHHWTHGCDSLDREGDDADFEPARTDPAKPPGR